MCYVFFLYCFLFFFFNETPTPEIYTLSLHDALPIFMPARLIWRALIAFKGGFAMFRTAIVALALLFTAGAAQAQGAEDRLKKIASTKTITIAYRTDAIPFSY